MYRVKHSTAVAHAPGLPGPTAWPAPLPSAAMGLCPRTDGDGGRRDWRAAVMASTMALLASACATEASTPEARVSVLPSAGTGAPSTGASVADPHQSPPPSEAQTYEEVQVSDDMRLVRPLLWNYEGFAVEPPVRAPSIILTDEHGGPVDLREATSGAYTLPSFGYTSPAATT